jgi:hypothetical protein
MTAHSLRTLGVLVAVVGATACAEHQYVYEPDVPNAHAPSGLPATRVAIPQEQPQGAVELTSYGMTQLNADGRGVAALHVRMIVTNDGDATPWQVDTTQQLLAIPGEGRSRAMFVNSDVHTMPIVAIGQHERHVIDLYYPLPGPIQNATRLPRFEVMWQVDTAARRVASRTDFDRVDIQPGNAYVYSSTYGYPYDYWPAWAGWGPYWWYDPYFPTVGFVHGRTWVGRAPGHVAVGGFRGGFAPVGGFHGGGGHIGRR